MQTKIKHQFLVSFSFACLQTAFNTKRCSQGDVINDRWKITRQKRAFLKRQQVLMLDLVEKRLFSQQEPKRTMKVSCCGIQSHRHMWSWTLSGKAALLAVHIFEMQEEITVSPEERKLTHGFDLQLSVFIIVNNCAHLVTVCCLDSQIP